MRARELASSRWHRRTPGGAIAAFRELLTDEATDKLNPVLLTGSSVLIDDDLKVTFEVAARHWLASNKYSVDFVWEEKEGFYHDMARSSWQPTVSEVPGSAEVWFLPGR